MNNLITKKILKDYLKIKKKENQITKNTKRLPQIFNKYHKLILCGDKFAKIIFQRTINDDIL